MLLSAVSILVVAQSSSEIVEGLMNNPVYIPVIQSGYPGSTGTIFSALGAIRQCNTNSSCSMELVAAAPDTGNYGVEPAPYISQKCHRKGNCS